MTHTTNSGTDAAQDSSAVRKPDWLSIARKHGYAFPDARMQDFVAELLGLSQPVEAKGAAVAGEVLSGWQWVPKEPTEAMRQAGAQFAECGISANAVFGYRAMIAAAPAPQAPASPAQPDTTASASEVSVHVAHLYNDNPYLP